MEGWRDGEGTTNVTSGHEWVEGMLREGRMGGDLAQKHLTLREAVEVFVVPMNEVGAGVE
jgi:hypothetical protein